MAAGTWMVYAFGCTPLSEIAVVIWATGYRSDYSWIHIPDLIEDGRVAHQRGVTHVPGLYFLGLSWQHTRGSALLGFVNDDATHLARHITHHHATPPTDATPTRHPPG